ncbi:hypothetical protein NA57DRAFT_53068 [Rhizodiscina lignyota]|uniref:SUN domain-containing protein n=1 Tax=Rhizodiscina lignyota TaxID=1504668 RepID=A0A9P4IL63_9PEZI|nr:hypothetical protein NA57DRAFT_53068 [Rhizodiscina lignyota]
MATPRRSSRLASRDTTPAAGPANPTSGTAIPSATPARSVAGSVAVSASGRRPRRGASTAGGDTAMSGALPPSQSRLSHGYGTTGRSSLAAPTTHDSAATSFAALLNQAREDTTVHGEASHAASRQPSVIPEVEEPAPESSIRASARASLSREPSVAPSAEVADTSVDASRSFGVQREAGVIPTSGLASEPVGVAPANARPRPRDRDPAVPWIFQGRNILYLFGSAVLIGYIMVLLFGGEIPNGDGSSFQTYGQRMKSNTSPVTMEQMAAQMVAQVTEANAKLDEANARVDWANARVDEANTRVAATTSKVDALNAEIATLKHSLPQYIAVYRNPDTGGYELLDHFWQALDSKFAEEYGRGDMPWKDWLRRNAHLIDTITRSRMDVHFDRSMAAALENYHVISRNEVLEMTKDLHGQMNRYFAGSNDWMKKQADQAVHSVLHSFLSDLGADFDNYDRPYMPWAFGAKLIQHLQNNANALNQVNFFSPKLGTIVNPHLTSATMAKGTKTVTQWLYALTPMVMTPNRPVEALLPWQEPGDCWCAAKADGKSQIGVILPYPVYPTAFVIEHVPKQGTLDIGSAPRDIELWVQAPSPAARDALANAYETINPGQPCLGGGSMPNNYVCVGKAVYDVDGWNHVQSFRLGVDFKALGIEVRQVVVRVTENHGQAWTCLYRTRLHGELAVKLG